MTNQKAEPKELSAEELDEYLAALACGGLYVSERKDRAIEKAEAWRAIREHSAALTTQRDALLKRCSEQTHRADWAEARAEKAERDAVMHANAVLKYAVENGDLRALLSEAIEALEPFARAAECLDVYDPQFPDHGAILRASADWFMRAHERDEAKSVDDLNKPLVAGDLRRAASLLAKLKAHKDGAKAPEPQP